MQAKKISQINQNDLHAILAARYGVGFAQWCMDRLPEQPIKGVDTSMVKVAA